MRYIQKLREIKEKYKSGINLIEYLKEGNEEKDFSEAIMISYDIQSGTYTQSDIKRPEVRDKYTDALAKVINNLTSFSSIVEAGVGEATTLSKLLPKLTQQNFKAYGFDISWSRIKYAQANCQKISLQNTALFTGDLFNIPIQNDAIDVVYTMHSLEPNGGREKEALKELFRITRKYLVLLEPDYNRANEEGKKRMDKLGYVKNLSSCVDELGYKIIEDRSFDYSVNALNPTGLLIIEKRVASSEIEAPLACPISKYPLLKLKDCFYCEESLLAYPYINGVPCLLPQNAVVATHFSDKM